MKGVVIWDWNGTLLDDTISAVDALNIMLEKRSLKSVSLEFYKSRFRFPAREFYKEIGITVPDSEWDDLAKEYHDTYAKIRSSLAVDAREALEIVASAGIRQTIASAMRQDLLDAGVSRFGIRSYFADVRGSDNLDGAGKVATVRALVESEIRAAGGEAVRFLMIGDSIHDKEVADALGLECVLCACGGHSAERLSAVSETVLTLTAAATRAVSLLQ